MNNIDVINIIKSKTDFKLLHSDGRSIPIKVASIVDDSQIVYKFWNRDKHEWVYNIQPLSFFVALFNQNRLQVA